MILIDVFGSLMKTGIPHHSIASWLSHFSKIDFISDSSVPLNDAINLWNMISYVTFVATINFAFAVDDDTIFCNLLRTRILN